MAVRMLIALMLATSAVAQDEELTGWDAYDANRALAGELGLLESPVARIEWPVGESPKNDARMHVTGGAVLCSVFTGEPDDAAYLNALAIAGMNGLIEDGRYLDGLTVGQYSWMVASGDVKAIYDEANREVDTMQAEARNAQEPLGSWAARRAAAAADLAQGLQELYLGGSRVVSMAGVGFCCLPFQEPMDGKSTLMKEEDRHWLTAVGCSTWRGQGGVGQVNCWGMLGLRTMAMLRDGTTDIRDVRPWIERMALAEIAFGPRTFRRERVPAPQRPGTSVAAGAPQEYVTRRRLLCAEDLVPEIARPAADEWFNAVYDAQWSFPPTREELTGAAVEDAPPGDEGGDE